MRHRIEDLGKIAILAEKALHRATFSFQESLSDDIESFYNLSREEQNGFLNDLFNDIIYLETDLQRIQEIAEGSFPTHEGRYTSDDFTYCLD